MKTLKKHPKQQRMEDMNIPGSFTKSEEKAIKKVAENIIGFSGGVTVDTISYVGKTGKKLEFPKYERQYLRSINNEHHYWHLLAGLILIGSIVASAYILTHGLVCAPASFEGKTVINCRVK